MASGVLKPGLAQSVIISHDTPAEDDAGPAVRGLGGVGLDDSARSLLTQVQVGASVVLERPRLTVS